MATTINQRELRNDSGAIMRRVQAGEEFTVTRNGTPIADLVPHRDHASGEPQRFVPTDALASGLGSLPLWGSAAFAGDLDELDRAVDDRDRDPWTRG